MSDHLLHAAAAAVRHLGALPDRAVSPEAGALAALAALDTPLQDAPQSADAVLAQLETVAGPATVGSAGGRYFGYVTGGALPVALAADWLVSAWDQNTTYAAAAPATTALERAALGWLVGLFGLPSDTGGAFVTGATMANVAALAAARHAVLRRAGWNVEADGLFGAPPVDVVIGAETHPSVLKALGLLGFGRARVTRVPADAQGRLLAGELPPLTARSIVCAQAGNVNTGAVDPLAAIARQTRAAGAWLHVDGAFGLWARTSPSTRPLCAGAEEADSWATDLHKWLNVPYDGGLVLVRDPAALCAAMAVSADYLPTADGAGRPWNPADHTPELSRRARGVPAWAALRHLGRDGVAALVDRCCRHARRFAAGLSVAGHAVLNDVVLNQVLVAFGDAAATRRVIAGVQADGTCWCGPSVFQGRTAMRISVSSWATTDDDVERSLAAILRLAAAHGS